MKLFKIISVLLLTSVICYLTAAAPNLDYLTEDECRGCHGDGSGNTKSLHHQLSDLNCKYCHIFPLADGWRSCDYCHVDFNHHDDVEGRCSDCHDDKQLKPRSR